MTKTSTDKRNNPAGREAAERAGFRVTARDAAIVAAVAQYRALTSSQIETLLFPSPTPKRSPTAINTRCRHRLHMLTLHGYLERREQPQLLSQGRLPYVYFLAKQGRELMEMQGEEVPRTEEALGFSFLAHLLSTNEVRIAITVSAAKHGFTVEQWVDDKSLKSPQMKDYITLTGPQGGKQKAAVVPDGFFLLDTGEYRYYHFLEIDLGTVTTTASEWGKRDWARKVATYLAYHHSGKYEARYQTQGLRILTVTTSDKRAQHLKAITEGVGGKARFWFTTFAQIAGGDVLTDPIWAVAQREGRESLVR